MDRHTISKVSCIVNYYPLFWKCRVTLQWLCRPWTKALWQTSVPLPKAHTGNSASFMHCLAKWPQNNTSPNRACFVLSLPSILFSYKWWNKNYTKYKKLYNTTYTHVHTSFLKTRYFSLNLQNNICWHAKTSTGVKATLATYSRFPRSLFLTPTVCWQGTSSGSQRKATRTTLKSPLVSKEGLAGLLRKERALHWFPFTWALRLLCGSGPHTHTCRDVHQP